MHEIADEHLLANILANNDELAKHNREHFDAENIFAVNFMSAPGAGKTTLLSHLIPHFQKVYHPAVIEGDMVGNLDAERLAVTGAPVFQISTGRSCHLDAQMIARVLHGNDIHNQNNHKPSILFIENVGNLVCPAEFPLGEHRRIVLLSVTEGDDKPLKYPVIFHNADAVVFSKCDLLNHVDFDLENASQYVKNLNANCSVFALSTKQEGSLQPFATWLEQSIEKHQLSKGEYTNVHSHTR
jgi:hydrogenase nickel incorporation protein HypB